MIDVSSLDQQSISQLAARSVDPETGLLAGDDAAQAATILRPSIDLFERYVGAQFVQVASVDEPFWQATAALATYQLHKNLGSIDEMLIELLLRYGFVLHAWEESLGITPGDVLPAVPRPSARVPSSEDLQPDGASLDVDAWIKDAALVCTNPYEPFSERLLELSTIELLGFQEIVQRYMDEPWNGHDTAVEAGVSHARFGYALRNRETQLIDCYGGIHENDPLAALAAHRAGNHGIKPAVAHRIVRDVIDYGDCELLYERTSGTTAVTRRAAIEFWGHTYADRDPRLDPATTTMLIEHGYFIHRLGELDPTYRDW